MLTKVQETILYNWKHELDSTQEMLESYLLNEKTNL